MRKSIDNVNRQDTLPEDNPLELIHTVMHQYRSQQYQVLRDGPHDITHMESKVLGYVHRHPGATQSDLSRDSGRDKAQLARLIKGLRERELLASEADAADRRNLRLSLTPQGRSVLRVLEQQSQRLAKQAVTGLDAGEQRLLVALLQRVSKNFGTAR
ncbi:MarR family winged helix-turn-helix transcriptional regulator [Piscinibacter sp.]|uniref:MarR family winged helix-turn-helix transcriptional regulator n=1 Tax=Piscinibacter sp. TaxID=1903157 RepID=UPI002CC91C69|nr:MarR family transcriptional regulator [Albitalea sp.]HUG23516.1 MarR family transcriptional regulator [Albitalea sp.]